MTLAGVSAGLLNKAISSHCMSTLSGSISAAGVFQPSGSQCAVFSSHIPRLHALSAASTSSAGSFCLFTTRALVDASVNGIAVSNDVENGHRQPVSGKNKRATVGRPELVEVIAALKSGEDVEKILAPWIEKFTPEEWNKVVAQTGEVDWKLVIRIFNVIKTKSVLAVHLVPVHDVVDGERELKLLKAFTAVGGVLAKHGREVEIEALITEMRSLGVVADALFFNALIRGYGNKGLVHLASQVLFQMDRHGVKPDTTTYERVIAAYLTGDKPQLEKAMQLLQGVRASNIMVAYKTLSDLMTACWIANRVEDADLLFQDMKAANYNIDSKAWVKLMHLHAKRGGSEVAEDLFQQMREAGVEANCGAFDALLLAYCRAGKTDQALSVFREYKLNMKPSLVAFNMIIDASGKAGRHEEAVQLYVDLIECRYRPDTVTYTSLISAVVQAGRYEKADELYRRMLDDRVEPSGHTYATMIHACARRGWTRYGHEICLASSRGTTGPLDTAVYGAMLHLYIKGRWYSHAAPVLEEMGRKRIEPDVAGYGTLISACGERDDRLFAPLAKAMMNSQFEPLQTAYRLVLVPPASDAVRSDLSPSPTDQSGETVSLSTVEADSEVEGASAFFKYYALTRGMKSNSSLHNALIDALWARNLRLRAKFVFLEAREIMEDFARPQYNDEVWTLDLRNLSKAVSQIALLHWLEEVAERAAACSVVAQRLTLVTGGRKEIHSVSRPYLGKGKGEGVVRETIEEIVRDLGLPFTLSSRVSGPAHLQAQTEQVIRWVSLYKDRLQLSNTPPS